MDDTTTTVVDAGRPGQPGQPGQPVAHLVLVDCLGRSLKAGL